MWIAATKRRPLESEVEAVLAQYGAIAEAREVKGKSAERVCGLGLGFGV